MIQATYKGDFDRERMVALVRAYPMGQNHVIDLPYRLCSWAIEDSRNISLWVDSEHNLLAWAVMQGPFWAIDYALHPAAPIDALTTILNWAEGRARESIGTTYGRPSWFIFVPSGYAERISLIEAAGFSALNNSEDTWTQVTLALDAYTNLPPCPAKRGFRLRTSRGQEEIPDIVALHREVFGTTNMTEAWRTRIIDHPAYQPELDLVVENASGDLVAFCLAWIAHLPRQGVGAEQIIGQIEPIGVREDVRRDGVAWVILAEALRRLRALGAGEILVKTDNYRDRAYAFYHGAGFRIIENITIFRKDYEMEESKG